MRSTLVFYPREEEVSKMPDTTITKIECRVFRWRRDAAISNAAHTYDDGVMLVVIIHTVAGVTGYGWIGGTAAERPLEEFVGFVRYYGKQLEGKSLTDATKLAWQFANDRKTFGMAGPHGQVLAAINIAYYDILGKLAGEPVWKVLGGTSCSVSGYIAGGYLRESGGVDDLQNELRENVAAGATAVKVKVGNPATGFSLDVERVHAAREAIGSEVQLMLDANCGFSYYDEPLATAVRYAQAFEQIDPAPFWLEEPFWPDATEMHERLAGETSISLATGENLYTVEQFVSLLRTRSIRYVNADVAIMNGGYDAVLLVAKYARSVDAILVPHGCQELQIHAIIASGHQRSWLEIYPPRLDNKRENIFHPKLEMDQSGLVQAPTTPGLGFELDFDFLEQFRVLLPHD